MSGLWQDCRYAIRVLVRARAQAALAVCTIGIAIGANTTIFTVVNATLLASLPFPDAGRIVQVAHASPDGSVDTSVSIPKYLFLRANATSFASLAAYQDLGGSGVNLTGRGEPPERAGATRVASAFFTVLGIQPALGRSFRDEDNLPGNGRVAVLSHQLWTRRFGGATTILGRTITINDEPFEVVGVMPPSFRFPQWAELWIPLEIDPASTARHGFLDVIGRLRPDTTLDAARAHARLLGDDYHRANPADMSTGETLYVRPLREALYGSLRPALLTLLAAVAAVLLIACVNVANLQLARAMTRTTEIGVRIALGATRGRILRQLLVESMVLSLAGGLLGLWMAAFFLPLVLHFAPAALEGVADVPVDGRVLAFTLLLSLVTAVLFGMLPARAAARAGARAAAPSRGVMGPGANTGVRRIMIGVEVAIAIMLATGAGLLARSFVTLVSASPGFNPRGLLTMQLHFSGTRYESGTAFATTVERLLGEVRALPGARAAALSTSLPFGSGTGMSFTIEGRVSDPEAGAGRMRYVGVTADFFAALGIPLVRGRMLDVSDRDAAPLVAVVNETAAREYWPGATPIGQRITIGQPVNPEIADPAPREVVGVVADVHEYGMVVEPPPMVYVPLAQVPSPLRVLFTRLMPLSLTMRTDVAPDALAAPARRAALRVDALLPVTGTRTGEQLLSSSLQAEQFNALLMGILALLALALAFSGIYGVVSCLVAQRTGEIGVRVALGATRADVMRLVMPQGLAPAVTGAIAGIAATLVSSRVLASLLVGVSTTDPIAVGGSALAVVLVASIAAYVPARRAARLDPVASLRADA